MSRRRLGLVLLVALGAALPLAVSPAAAPPARAPVSLQLARGFHFGGGFASRPRPSLLGRRTIANRGRSRGILRSIGRALAFAAIFHFLFAGSHGLGFVFLLILIVGLMVLVSRGRRRRAAYSRPRW